MEDLTSRAAYLKGLADGMKLDTESNEGRLLNSIIDLLGDMAEKVSDIDDEQGFLADQIDDMSEAMEMLGEEVFGFGDEDDEDMYQITCENCGEEITFTEDDLDDLTDGSFSCPNCGEVIELEFGGCDCGCEDHHHE